MTQLGPRWDYARRAADDSIIDGSLMSAAEWRILQETYQLGELVMPCCPGAAIPKRSSNGMHFFAHAGGECSSAPESQWHIQAKTCVRDTARNLGYPALLEQPGTFGVERWCADVWIPTPQGAVVVEVQHSAQHLRDYMRRQRRYEAAGMRCLWLIINTHYKTLLNATMKQRYREEFARKWPEGQSACIAELPVAMLELAPSPRTRGPKLDADLEATLSAFLTGRFGWRDGAWRIDVAGAPKRL